MWSLGGTSGTVGSVGLGRRVDGDVLGLGCVPDAPVEVAGADDEVLLATGPGVPNEFEVGTIGFSLLAST